MDSEKIKICIEHGLPNCCEKFPHTHPQIEEIAEKLYEQTMAGIQYGDGRDLLEWKELVKNGFVAYAKDALQQATQRAYEQGREATLAEVKKVCDKMKAEIKTPDGYASTYYNIKSSCDYNKLLDEIALALLSTIEK